MALTSQKTYAFTLTLTGAAELTAEIADALHESGCDDAFLYSRGATLFLEFEREAATFEDAVASARADVGRAGVGLTVDSVDRETPTEARNG